MSKVWQTFVCLAVGLLVSVASQASLKTVLPKEAVMRIVVEEAQKAGISPELALAVAQVESNFTTHALSHAGARGVMQIMPATARGEFGVSADRLYNPRVNAKLGSEFLRQLIDRYDGRLDIALSHYNGGSRVRLPNGGLRVIPATRGYVDKVLDKVTVYRQHPMVLALNDQREPGVYQLAKVQQQRASLVHRLRRLQQKNTRRSGLSDWTVSKAYMRPMLDDFEDPNSRLNRQHKYW